MGCAMVAGAVIGGVMDAVHQYNQTGQVNGDQVLNATAQGAAIGGAVVIGVVAAAAVAPMAAAALSAAIADGDPTNEMQSAAAIGQDGVDTVLSLLQDPSAQTGVKVYVNEAGKRSNLFARFDILTDTAIHEVKNVQNLSLSQNFMAQAEKYKKIADGAGLELHYWLMNDSPKKVIDWLNDIDVYVHNSKK